MNPMNKMAMKQIGINQMTNAMMMQNMVNNNQNQCQSSTSNNADNSNSANKTQSPKKNDNQGGMNIIFKSYGEGGEQKEPPLNIQCLAEEKVVELIQKYRTKSNDHYKSKIFISI